MSVQVEINDAKMRNDTTILSESMIAPSSPQPARSCRDGWCRNDLTSADEEKVFLHANLFQGHVRIEKRTEAAEKQGIQLNKLCAFVVWNRESLLIRNL